MDLYIYYRVSRAQAQILQALVNAMQTKLRTEYAVRAALKRRPRVDPDQDGNRTDDANVVNATGTPDTWMEVYLAVPDDFESSLQRAFDDAGYAALIDGTRHIEYFQDCTPCV